MLGNLGSVLPFSQMALSTGCSSTFSPELVPAFYSVEFSVMFASACLRFYLLGISCEQGPVPALRSTQLINNSGRWRGRSLPVERVRAGF